MAYCTNCGSYVADGTRFCPNCGAPVGSAGGNTYNGNANYNTFQQKSSGGYRANVKKRDIAVCVILSIVTLGIYGLIWFFRIVNDVNSAAQTPNDTSPGTVLLLTIVTCGIYGWIWLYQTGEKIDTIRQWNGEAPQSSALMYLLLAVFGLSLVDYCLIQTELNKVAVDA